MPTQDYALKELFSFVLGRRVFFDLIFKQGLSYEAVGFLFQTLQVPVIYVSANTEKKNSERVRSTLYNHIAGMLQADLTDEDLETHKRELMGVYALGMTRSLIQAEILGLYESTGKTGYTLDKYYNDIRTVNAKQLTAWAKNHVDFDKLTTIILEPTTP